MDAIRQVGWNSESQEFFNISRDEINALVSRVRDTAGGDLRALEELSKWASSVQYKSARSLVGALPDYGERLAERLGKSVRIRVEGGDTRMDPEVMRPVTQSLVHLVRNAIDHGIEAPGLRGSKSEVVTLTIKCQESATDWIVIIEDNGAGIDTQRVVERAIANGFLTKEKAFAMNISEKCRLIFLNDVSTMESVSEISGRGVGMGAVEAAVKESGGQLDITSAIGEGTAITIRVPKQRPKMRPAMVA